jgi:hypothetical protein
VLLKPILIELDAIVQGYVEVPMTVNLVEVVCFWPHPSDNKKTCMQLKTLNEFENTERVLVICSTYVELKERIKEAVTYAS